MGEDLPVGLKLERIHKFLAIELDAFSSEEILQHTGVDIENTPAILDSLTGDASKVLREKNGKWRWASKFQLTNSIELRSLIGRSLDGVSERDLFDSYKTVKDDIRMLKKKNAVYEVKSGSRTLLFPRDPRLNVDVSEELQTRYKQVPLLEEIEVHRYLVANGLKQTDDANGVSIAQPVARKRPGKRTDRKRSKRVKLTNQHMVGSNVDLTKEYDAGKESAFK